MRKYVLPSVAAVLALASAPASAAELLFETEGQEGEVVFGGGSLSDGLSGRLALTLVEIAGNSFTFAYSLMNTSDASNLVSRISTFAFNTDPNTSSVTILSGFTTVIRDGNLPGQNAFELCFKTGQGNNCNNGTGGATLSSPVNGSFILNLGGPATSSVTLSNFLARYQSTGPNGEGSAVGVGTAVPEPGTWLLMILGLGAVGFAMRRRQTTSVRFQFA